MTDGWKSVRLGEICSFEKEQAIHEGLPYVGLEHIESGTGQFLGSKDIVKVRSATFRFSKAHVLYGRLRPYLNKVLLPDFDGHCSTEIFPIKPCAGLLREYLFYWLSMDTTVEAIDATSTGARMPRANMNAVLDFRLPMPPLPDQRRIVAILDEAFEGIATAKANAEKNLQNAREVFEGHLQDVFDRDDEEWRKTTISEATGGVFTGPFGSLLHKSDYIEDGIPLVNPAHISDGGIEPDYRKSVSEATAQRLSNYVLRTGDIVMGRRGEMGRCAVVTDAEDGWLCGTGSFVIRSGNQCDARFLVRLLRSQGCKKRLEAIAGGAVMPNLSNTDFGNFEIRIPPLGLQLAVLGEVEALAGEVQRLEGVYQRKLAAFDELKKSLLHQAFSGQL